MKRRTNDLLPGVCVCVVLVVVVEVAMVVVVVVVGGMVHTWLCVRGICLVYKSHAQTGSSICTGISEGDQSLGKAKISAVPQETWKVK